MVGLRSVWLVLVPAVLSACSPPRGRGEGGDGDSDSDTDDDGGLPPIDDAEACAFAASSRSYEGCEYFAVDLPNYPIQIEGMEQSPADSQYAVVVSNGDERSSSRVSVFELSGGEEREIDNAEVSPRSTHVFELGPGDVAETGAGGHAFRLEATRPITAYQFNPLNNTEEAFSNDASLLIPTTALGQDYVAVTPDAGGGGDYEGQPINLGAFVAVVAVSDDPVHVTVRPTADVEPGSGIGSGTTPIEATLDKYEVLNVVSSAIEDVLEPIPRGDGNLSGTRVTADGPIAVFAGSVCSFAPTGESLSCCCDHTEEQMFPLSSLGRTFVGAPSASRSDLGQQPDVWRVTAGVEPVTLEWVDRPGGAPSSLDALESVEFESAEPFVVSANDRIQLTQFLTSSDQVLASCETSFDCDDPLTEICYYGRCILTCDPDRNGDDCPFLATCMEAEGMAVCAAMGDPAMILVPPTEQFRSDYVFLTPDDYAHDYVTVVAPDGASVEIDGDPIGGFRPAGAAAGTDYVYASQELHTDGTHIVTASAPVALIVYGYDRYVSYGYPAGLDLEELLY